MACMIIYNACSSATSSTVPIWNYWTNSGTASSITNHAWQGWTQTNCNTATMGTIWLKWSDATGNPIQYQPYVPPPPTAEQLAEEKKRRLAAEAKAKEEERKRKESEARAEELLQRQLDAEQRKEYAKDKTFTVTGADHHRYRIRNGWSGHVERLCRKSGKPLERFCIHPRERVPIPDNQLISKLMLETDPAEFRRVANVTQLAHA